MLIPQIQVKIVIEINSQNHVLGILQFGEICRKQFVCEGIC